MRNRNRISGIKRDSEEFGREVQKVACEIDASLAELTLDATVDELNHRLNKARTTQKDWEHNDQLAKKLEQKIKETADVISVARAGLTLLCDEAKCSSVESLESAIKSSLRKEKIEREIRNTEEIILSFAAGSSLPEFIEDVGSVDADSLEANIGTLKQQIEQLKHEIEKLGEIVGGEQNALNGMDGNSTAALLADKEQHLLAQLTNAVEEYAVFRIADELLKRAIERYKEKNQSPIMSRASSIFRELTLKSFSGLIIDSNDKAEPEMFGVRAKDGSLVNLSGMSEGTGDQLFLALRLASLESYLDSNEAVPFIVDDILVNFDDERAVATLKCLQALSRRTQVVLFTHHSQTVKLARETIERI